MARVIAAQTIKALGDDIVNLRRQKEILEREHRQRGDIIDKQAADMRLKLDELEILYSDRDRLTAALEVCVRRLASPQVEKMGDRRRAGWRANSYTNEQSSLYQDATPLRG
jgi:SMC interacting uncharacterized protein involved in chromosome segregation